MEEGENWCLQHGSKVKKVGSLIDSVRLGLKVESVLGIGAEKLSLGFLLHFFI